MSLIDVTLEIGLPPPLSKLTNNFDRRRIKSQEAIRWADEMALKLMLARCPRLQKGKIFSLMVELWAPRKKWYTVKSGLTEPRKTDTTNRIKLLEDVLASWCRVDDCIFFDIRFVKKVSEQPHIRIVVDEMEEGEGDG